MERLGNETIILTKDELEAIRKYKKIESSKNEDKKLNVLLSILGLMILLISLIGIGNIGMLGHIYELLNSFGGIS